MDQASQVLALPAGHPLARKRPLKWIDFDNQELVLIHPGAQHGFYDAFFAECAKAGAKPRPVQYANDVRTKMWLVSAGFGIAPTSDSLAEAKRPGLILRPLPPGLPPIYAVLAWRRDDPSPALAHFCASFQPFPSARGLKPGGTSPIPPNPPAGLDLAPVKADIPL